jgi:hypothetical protein
MIIYAKNTPLHLQIITLRKRKLESSTKNANGETLMIQAIQIPAEYSAGDKSSPARQIPAVAHCCEAWESTYQAKYSHDKNEFTARRDAAQAYRNAMPALFGYQNICDFIACAAYGLGIGVISDATGSKLLYAAQIAFGVLRGQPKPPQIGQA